MRNEAKRFVLNLIPTALYGIPLTFTFEIYMYMLIHICYVCMYACMLFFFFTALTIVCCCCCYSFADEFYIIANISFCIILLICDDISSNSDSSRNVSCNVLYVVNVCMYKCAHAIQKSQLLNVFFISVEI